MSFVVGIKNQGFERRRRSHCSGRLSLCAVLLACLSFASVPVQASWFSSLRGSFFNDDNLSRSELSRDIESDSGLGVVLDSGYAWELEKGKRFTVTGSLAADLHDEFGGMDRVGAALDLGFRNRLGLGAQAPTVRLAVGVGRDEFDVGVRDAWSYRAQAAIGKRVGERWEIEVGLGFESRRADETIVASTGPGPTPGPAPGPGPTPGPGPAPPGPPGPGPDPAPGDTFDTDLAQLDFSAEYTLASAWWLNLGYSLFSGDVVSNSTATDEIVAAADAITDDPVFGAGRFAYRLDAISHRFSMGVGRALGQNGSLSLDYDYELTDADNGIDYDKGIVRLTAVFSF